MALHEKVSEERKRRLKATGRAVPERLQGVSKKRIEEVLDFINQNDSNRRDAVFALLDNETPSWFSGMPAGSTIADGATTAHIGCHVGILQRNEGKLDREGRDYWLKPLREVGAIEPVMLDSKTRRFLPGHLVAKSPYNAYRLSESFVKLLQVPAGELAAGLKAWSSQSAVVERREFQARMAKESAKLVDDSHKALIRACAQHYAPRFLPGFEVVYTDDSDGTRVEEDEATELRYLGIEITLEDPMPDLLLVNKASKSLWVIEAVTSDGEVDEHKIIGISRLAKRSGYSVAGFTTAYPNYKTFATRQAAHKNLAAQTFVWVLEDPAKQFYVDANPVQVRPK